jgi:AcrR family transcriptional regulator
MRAGAPVPGISAFEEKRAEITAIAAALFDREGYSGANMHMIAEAAGLRKPTIYHYFQSKSDLLVQIHNDFMQLLFDQLVTVPRDAFPPDQRLRSVMEHILSLIETHRPHVRTFFEHYRELPPNDRAAISSGRRTYENAVVEIIADGVAQGTFRPVEPYSAAMVVFGACNWAYQWLDPSHDAATTADSIWDLIWNGLGSGGATVTK